MTGQQEDRGQPDHLLVLQHLVTHPGGGQPPEQVVGGSVPAVPDVQQQVVAHLPHDRHDLRRQSSVGSTVASLTWTEKSPSAQRRNTAMSWAGTPSSSAITVTGSG